MYKEYTNQELLDLAAKIDIHKIKDATEYWNLAKQIPDLCDEILELRQIIEEHCQLAMERDLYD